MNLCVNRAKAQQLFFNTNPSLKAGVNEAILIVGFSPFNLFIAEVHGFIYHKILKNYV
jgi:hypothetical protein